MTDSEVLDICRDLNEHERVVFHDLVQRCRGIHWPWAPGTRYRLWTLGLVDDVGRPWHSVERLVSGCVVGQGSEMAVLATDPANPANR